MPGFVAGERGDEARTDEKIFLQKMNVAAKEGLTSKPIGDVVAALGQSFIGTRYIAHSLEAPGKEHLVVNLRAFDCTTFMENCLVLARCVKLKIGSFEAYKRQLQLVRYRGGQIDGYPSRLHYLTDWVADNERKKVVMDVTTMMGGIRAGKVINFMSTHPAYYPQLSDAAYAAKIREAEKQLTARSYTYLPKEYVEDTLDKIRSGDIIGMATSKEGIDVSHTGLALRIGKTVKFLHAPLSGGFVQVSDGSLAEYLTHQEFLTGITVARPLDPAGTQEREHGGGSASQTKPTSEIEPSEEKGRVP